MKELNDKKAGWKQKLVREMKVYWLNVGYLFLFFGMFTIYRRLILAQHQISYLHYGISLAEALVLAKVIMLGEVLHLSRGFEQRPLIVPTLYKALIFSVLVGVFAIAEHTVIGLIRGRSLALSLQQMLGENRYELIAKCLVTFMAFIPFFGMRELERVLGRGKMIELFFYRKAPDFQSQRSNKR